MKLVAIGLAQLIGNPSHKFASSLLLFIKSSDFHKLTWSYFKILRLFFLPTFHLAARHKAELIGSVVSMFERFNYLIIQLVDHLHTRINQCTAWPLWLLGSLHWGTLHLLGCEWRFLGLCQPRICPSVVIGIRRLHSWTYFQWEQVSFLCFSSKLLHSFGYWRLSGDFSLLF